MVVHERARQYSPQVTYPNREKIWRGYTHTDTANTFQDDISDKFSRVGQLAFDNSGSKGDLIAEYDFNGLRRMVRRNHPPRTARRAVIAKG